MASCTDSSRTRVYRVRCNWFVSSPCVMCRKRGLDCLDNIVSRHDIRSKLGCILKRLSDLFRRYMKKVMSILVIIDGFLLDFSRSCLGVDGVRAVFIAYVPLVLVRCQCECFVKTDLEVILHCLFGCYLDIGGWPTGIRWYSYLPNGTVCSLDPHRKKKIFFLWLKNH